MLTFLQDEAKTLGHCNANIAVRFMITNQIMHCAEFSQIHYIGTKLVTRDQFLEGTFVTALE